MLKLSKFGQIIILLAVTFAVYSNTLKNSFVIEDPIYITNWKLTQSLGNIGKMFGGDTAPTGNVGIYRPLRGVFYALSYKLYGGESAFSYRLQALLVQLAVTVLVYLIVESLISKVKTQNSKLQFKTQNFPLPFFSALLFALHPVNSEAVDYLTANFDAIAYIFFFGSFYCYLKSRISKNPSHPPTSLSSSYVIPHSMRDPVSNHSVRRDLDSRFRGNDKVKKGGGARRGEMFWYVISIVLAGFAFFHFEMTLTLPILIVLYEAILGQKKGKVKVLPYFIFAFVYLFIRFVVVKMTARGEYLEGSFYLTMLTMLKVFVKYLQMLIFPWDLSINPRLAGGIGAWVHPLANPERIREQTIFNPVVILSIFLIITLVGAVFYLRKRFPLLSFSIGWFLIALLPVSYIIPQMTIFQERYLYIASFGFVIFLVAAVRYANDMRITNEFMRIFKDSLWLVIVCLLVFYGFRTYMRNMDWKDSYAVWTKLAKQTPDDVLANFSAASQYQLRGQDEEAIVHYQKALSLESRLHEARFELGEIYKGQGRFDLAAVQYQLALQIFPDYERAKNALLTVNNREEDAWKQCKISTLIFSCPIDGTSYFGNTVNIADPKSNFIMNISLDTADEGGSFETYLKNDRDETLEYIGEGMADIPGFELVYVRNFTEGKVQKMQFYLFSGNNVVKVLVGGGDGEKMQKFDRLVTSMRFSGRVNNLKF